MVAWLAVAVEPSHCDAVSAADSRHSLTWRKEEGTGLLVALSSADGVLALNVGKMF